MTFSYGPWYSAPTIMVILFGKSVLTEMRKANELLSEQISLLRELRDGQRGDIAANLEAHARAADMEKRIVVDPDTMLEIGMGEEQ